MKPWHTLLKQWQQELNEIKQEEQNTIAIGAKQKKIAQLETKISLINGIDQIENKIQEYKTNAENEKDSNMKALWLEEIDLLKNNLNIANNNLIQALIPNQEENIILEIRAGEGGSEAAIFALELYNMYIKLCKKRSWEIKTLNISYMESGTLKEGMFEISGKGVASWLFNESGVHCVKRIPKTEKKGRTHTSTATVAILPEPKEVEVQINEKDLKIDVFRSSGPGGQSVNTTDSAVRITHIPTNIVVSQQDEKSQHKNKEKAMKILKARIYQKQLADIEKEHSLKRKNAIGTAKRNERIRTYHFMQNWVKDIRIEKTCHDITNFMEGHALSEFLDELIWNIIE